jgi:hypothetical protein
MSLESVDLLFSKDHSVSAPHDDAKPIAGHEEVVSDEKVMELDDYHNVNRG